MADRVNVLKKNNDKSRYNESTTTKKPGSSKYYLERKNKKRSVYTVSRANIAKQVLPSEYVCEFAVEVPEAYQWENYILSLIGLSGSAAHCA